MLKNILFYVILSSLGIIKSAYATDRLHNEDPEFENLKGTLTFCNRNRDPSDLNYILDPAAKILLLKKSGRELDRVYIPEIPHSRLDKIAYFVLGKNLPYDFFQDGIINYELHRTLPNNTFKFTVSDKYLVEGRLKDSHQATTIEIVALRKPPMGFSNPNWFALSFDFPDPIAGLAGFQLDLTLHLTITNLKTNSQIWSGTSNHLRMMR